MQRFIVSRGKYTVFSELHDRATLPAQYDSERIPRGFFSESYVTTNLSFSQWTALFENTAMVFALGDRLTFRAQVFDLSGSACRLLTVQPKAGHSLRL